MCLNKKRETRRPTGVHILEWLRPPLVADTKENIGLVYAKTGKKSEAKTMFTEAAKIRRNMLGPDHPLTKKAERLAAK